MRDIQGKIIKLKADLKQKIIKANEELAVIKYDYKVG